LAAALLAALAGSACNGLISAEFTDPELCKTYTGESVPGAGIFGGITTTFGTFFVIDVGTDFPKLNDAHLKSKVTLLSADLTPHGGVTDFKFLQGLKVDVASGVDGSTLPRVNVIDFTVDPATPMTSDLLLEGNSNTDVSPYIDQRYVKFFVDFTGAAPANAWTFDVTLCFAVQSDYTR
jgi:hypothetical protein